MRDSNRAARDTSATAKETFKSATEFLRKKGTKDFESESKDILTKMKD
jgi:hypothetical protein